MQYTEIFSPEQIENFVRKKNDIFLIFAQNIDCGYTLKPPRQGGSNEYPQSMFWSKNKKNMYTPANLCSIFGVIRPCFSPLYTLFSYMYRQIVTIATASSFK